VSAPLTGEPVYSRPPSLCSVCGTPLAPVLMTAGYATHPCCDPEERAWEYHDGMGGRKVVPLARPRRRAEERGFTRPSSRKQAARGAEPPPPEAPPAQADDPPSRPVRTVETPPGLF
jgi:hypothetical protein